MSCLRECPNNLEGLVRGLHPLTRGSGGAPQKHFEGGVVGQGRLLAGKFFLNELRGHHISSLMKKECPEGQSPFGGSLRVSLRY